MSEKDVTEKILEDYNDVFADIVNGLVFQGEQRVHPSDLREGYIHSEYRSDDSKIHELERDVIKDWGSSNARIAICGIENQTKPEKYMPMRVFGYEGSSYRTQVKRKKFTPVPVVTLILYLGTKRHWNYSQNLRDIISVPQGMEDYVNDFKIHVFEISWLTDEELDYFHSDFRIVANFFVQKRRQRDYRPSDPTEIQHVDEVLKLLSVMTGDDRYEKILALPGKGKVHTMCDVADRLEKEGIAKGLKQGLEQGLEQGIKQGVEQERLRQHEVDISRAKALLQRGLSLDEIQEMYSDVTQEEILG